MSTNVRNIIISAIVAVLAGAAIGFVDGYVEARTGQPSAAGMTAWFLPAILGAFTFLILKGVSGNKKVAMADPAERERMLGFEPEPGRSLLVIFREGFVGSAVGVNIHVDGVMIAQLKSPRFTAFSVTPGAHQLIADSQSSSGALKSEPFEVRTSEGQTVVLKLAMNMGGMKNTLKFEPRTDLDAARARLRSMPMVTPEAPAAF